MEDLRPTKDQIIDLGYRAGWTAVQAFSGGLLGTAIFDLSAGEAAGVAALAAALSTVKTFASQRLGKSTS
jgi:hypothetical protein|tara:strand:- start:6704 stop:6913 length:210 start_codon:yes stop_codon:yes gene_type:complete